MIRCSFQEVEVTQNSYIDVKSIQEKGAKNQHFPHEKNKIICDRIILSFRIFINSSSFYKGDHRKKSTVLLI